jgi:hypothetical protein
MPSPYYWRLFYAYPLSEITAYRACSCVKPHAVGLYIGSAEIGACI